MPIYQNTEGYRYTEIPNDIVYRNTVHNEIPSNIKIPRNNDIEWYGSTHGCMYLVVVLKPPTPKFLLICKT